MRAGGPRTQGCVPAPSTAGRRPAYPGLRPGTEHCGPEARVPKGRARVWESFVRRVATLKILAPISVLGGLLLTSPSAFGGAHTWRVNEIFSNPSGTIQFVELREANGGDTEGGVDGQRMRSNAFPAHMIDLIHPIDPNTANDFLLGGTTAFASLPGSPPLDFMIPSGFLSTAGPDVIHYGPGNPLTQPTNYDQLVYAAGGLPLDGLTALLGDGTTGQNSPTNNAGEVGFVNASPPQPPGVPDGTGGSTPMLVTPLDLTGSMLSIAWDTSVCTGDNQHHILYGDGSMFPVAPGNPFGLLGSVCALGGTSPFVWSSVPTAADSTGILWWVIVVKNGPIEGSWGTDSAGTERIGPGTGGSSGLCSITTLSTTNVCGH